jgi:hypothetical protein
MRRLAPWIAILAVFAFATVARHAFIEPEAYGRLCEVDGAWWCPLRQAIIATFTHQGLGWIALCTGIAAFVLNRSSLAMVAALTGAAGLVLYCYEFSAVGFTLGVLVLSVSGRTDANTGNA